MVKKISQLLNKAIPAGTDEIEINASGASFRSPVSALFARAQHTGTQTASTISDFDTQVRTSRLDQMASATAPITVQDTVHTGRNQEDKGANEAAADVVTLDGDGNTYHITGTGTINHIIQTSWQLGSKLTLIFDAAATVNHDTGGEAGAEASIYLTDEANRVMAAQDTLTLVLDTSTRWLEISGGGGGGGSSTFAFTIPCTMEAPEGTVAFPDVHVMSTTIGKKLSGFVLPNGASTGIVNFKCILPSDVNATTNATLRFRFLTLAALTNLDVSLVVRAKGFADDEDADVAFETDEAEQILRMPNANDTYKYYSEVLNGTYASNDTVHGQIARSPQDADDDYTGDILLVGVDFIIDRTV